MALPIHVNSIGTIVFWDLDGPFDPLQERTELIERPGVDGVGMRTMAKAGQKFELRSVSYFASFTTAAAFLTTCKAITGTNPVTLIRNSVTLGTVLVLKVTEAVPPHAVISAAGPVGAQARAELKWSLVHFADP